MNVLYYKKQNNTSREMLFFIAIFLKMLVQTISISVIPFMVGEDKCRILFKLMTYSSYMLVIILVLTAKKMRVKELLLISIIVIITAMGSIFTGNEILLTFIYIYGAKKIDLKKVFNKAGFTYIFVFLAIIIMSFVGIIENWDFFTNSDRPRWGLGYSYPTHTSSVLFMCFLIFCFIMKEKLSLLWVIILECFNLWIFKYTDSRAGFYLSIIVPIIFYLLKFKKKSLCKSGIAWLMQWSFPGCALIIFFMTYFYNGKGLFEIINKLLSKRLSISQASINTYGIHLFGQKIQWVGWGGWGHSQTQLSGTYNYVDSAFLKLLLENGIIVWSLIILAWTIVCVQTYRNNDKYLFCALVFLALYCVVEQWLMNLGANLFVIFLAYCIFDSGKENVTTVFNTTG